MIRYQSEDLLFLTLCLLLTSVSSLNYGYTVSRARSYPAFLSSAPSTILGSSSSNTNRTLEGATAQKTNKTEKIFPIYYPIYFPQRRGGKNLNLTVVTESPPQEKEQARILNKSAWYSNFSVPGLSFKKVPAISQTPSPFQNNDDKRSPLSGKNAPTTLEILSYNYPSKNLGNRNIDSIYSSEGSREPESPSINFRQPKTLSYPSPQQFVTPNDVPVSFVIRKKNKTSIGGYTLTPQLYQATSGGYNFPPPRQETIQNWPCFCVPYYLCKNGVINSGGRSVAAFRRWTRSLTYDFKNKTQFPSLVQPKVMNAYALEQDTDRTQCEGQKVCCRLSFADDVPVNNDGEYYPVATPRPEPYYPFPPRFSNRERELETCGIRRAYGLHTRLRHVQYPADVSEFGEYPWQIAILRKIEGQKSLYLCGGTLISSQWVVTAAHCIKNEQFSPLIIRLGEWDVNRRDELYPFIEIDVDSILLHPEFNPDTLYNDLALIRMKAPVNPRLPHITPACLPNRETLYEDQRCWVSGWGKDFFGPKGEYQSVLKEVDVPVIMREICSSELKNTYLGPDFVLHPGFLCAGGEAGKDACTGDGGSPLVCMSDHKWFVVGLVSWGIGCGQPGVPGVYVNMLYYIDWINSVIGR